MRSLLIPKFALALTAALPLVLPISAHAFCGFYAGKADANLFNEASQVVVVRDGNRTVLSMLNDYSGPLSEFALIVPTPTVLQKGQVRIADRLTFERLDAYSSPRLAQYHDSDPCVVQFDWGQDAFRRFDMLSKSMVVPAPVAARQASALRDKALGVTVEAQYTLEEYDIVSLSATQSDGLEIWLRENGYQIPKGASAALKPYINQGMKFFVAKVNLKEQLKTGYTTLRPLQFAFESDKFMLPMRLGMLNAPPSKPQDLIVYLLTKNGRVESSNYRTVKLPANMNLPYFVKPKFQDFYKAMFASEAIKEDHRVVFTEYFWDMAWCDPCAANPLSPQELRNAGVFWVGGNADDNFAQISATPASGTAKATTAITATAIASNALAAATTTTTTSNAGPAVSGPAPRTAPLLAPTPNILRPMPGGGAQPVVLTRLHVRYTAATFPEDLMFTQTKDRQNWQARYVIQNPYEGSVAQCSAKVGEIDCETLCKGRVTDLFGQLTEQLPGQTAGPKSSKRPGVVVELASSPNEDGSGLGRYIGKEPAVLQRDCIAACTLAKRDGVAAATRYYRSDLPARITAEKKTLAQLTGWKLSDIDALPGANQFVALGGAISSPSGGAGGVANPAPKPWWERLFGTRP